MTLTRPSRAAEVLAAYLVVFTAAILVWGRGGEMPVLVADAAYMPFRIGATALMWMAARVTEDRNVARGWLLLAAGQACAVAGNATWVVSDITGAETSNLTYLAWTVPMQALNLAGYAQMLRSREGRSGPVGDWVDAGILVVAAASVAWYFIAAQLVTTGYDDPLGVLLFFYDSAGNAATLMFAVTVWLRAPRGLAPGAMPRTVVGLLLIAPADLVIERQLVEGAYRSGALLDVWYAASVVVLALGANAQYRNPAGAGGAPSRPDRADAMILVALVAALVPLVAEIFTSDLQSRTLSAAGAGVVILMLLVLWRQRLARTAIERLVDSRLRLEQQLWQSQKQETIGRLAGGIAHDFNNILTVISSHAQLLRSRTSADVAGESAEIQFATERAAVLVRRLLTFSGATATDRRPVRLGEVISSLQPMLRQLVVSGITLDVDLADEQAEVHLADGQLEQIVLNLVVNAKEATAASGRIRVSTRRVLVEPGSRLHGRGVGPGNWALLAVADTGSGMDAATRARLFEPFFTTKAAAGGTGLGLATVGGIVQAAEGHIVVESDAGRGTTMSVYLPIVPRTEPAPATGAPTPRATTPAAARVLVVDDELPIRAALAKYLRRLGYQVLEAADGTQALSLMDQHAWAVDLVLTDVRMPGGSGLELADAVHARRPELPVLFMSGHAEGMPGPGRQPPPREHTVDKPFDLELVAARIRSRLASTPP